MSLLNLTTPRLRLREFAETDVPFILHLLNEPGWLRFIGDRNVRTPEHARGYIDRVRASYALHGFGLLCVESTTVQLPVGMCGLIKRGSLNEIDLGYAMLQQHWRKGFAFEAAQAVLAQARARGHGRIVAITNLDNLASIQLLQKLGLRFERELTFEDGDRVKLFATQGVADAGPCC